MQCKRPAALLCFVIIALASCKKKNAVPPLFKVLDYKRTGLNFSNNLKATPAFNMFRYMYFYNGAGVGAGDFNNDGLTDLFFASNQAHNKLFINRGAINFTDETAAARIPQDGGWSTGVSIVDINNDGLLDIYISKVGDFEGLKSKNQLLVCQGLTKDSIPTYTDNAALYGLDFSGFSTQAAFFDYDLDGDLDCFLLNHSVHQNGTFGERKMFLGTYHPLSGDRLYRNDGEKFTDVTPESQIHSSAISYGLGIAVSDIDLDGYPDMYMGNDFHENDYLYINQQNGIFKDVLTEKVMHTSQFSMGVDVADVSNDGFPEIISMDMLPADPYILKRSLGEDEFNTFYLKVGYGYNYQYTRNNLQWNRRNGMFSEIGLFSGVAATDWSWAPLWMDFDNDGWKDLFISNGIPKRLNDIDYVNYVTTTEIQQKIRNNQIEEADMQLIDKFPQIKLPNRFFKNGGNLGFTDMAGVIENDQNTYSNGAVYADLDNDGDLDVVVNNIDDPAMVYENQSNKSSEKNFVKILLRGAEKNINAVGSKVLLYTKGEVRTYEKYPVRGFLSSMEVPLHIGLKNTTVDSAFLIWPDNTFQKIDLNVENEILRLNYQQALPSFDYSRLQYHGNSTKPMVNNTNTAQLFYKHEENNFIEFDREPLIPFMVSRDGPALAVADVNGDGLEDVFIGAARTKKSALFILKAKGTFIKTSQPALDADSLYEDVDAIWTDVNSDGFPDLVIASGGNEYYGKDEHLLPRIYLNNGSGIMEKKQAAFKDIFITASSVVPLDFNGDGKMDLFIGGRTVPWDYGQIPRSYLLQNDGTGTFADVTPGISKELSYPGIVKGANAVDLDRDGDLDLLLSLEWGGITAFLNNKGHFTKKDLCEEKGWWNFTLPVDVDGDGDLDIIAGNQGLNNRLKPTKKEPVRLYYNDFDGNGKKEQLLTYYLDGKELPFANKDELQKQMPFIKKNFLLAENFAKASLQSIFSEDKLKKSDVLTADYFQSVVLINDGKMNYAVKPLPWAAQVSPYKTAVVVQANGDSLPDVLMFGNFYESNIQMGRYDADFGTLLINKGRGSFDVSAINGLAIKGQVRRASKIKIGNRENYILSRNNDSTLVIGYQ